MKINFPNTSRLRVALHLIILLYLLAPALAQAELAPNAASEPAAVPAPAPVIPEELKSPRATMTNFLEAMTAVSERNADAIERAVMTLDVDDINPLIRYEKGSELAWLLHKAIRRTREPDTSRFSTRTEGPPYVFQSYSSGKIEISFTPDIGWRFSKTTLAALPAILDELRQTRAEEKSAQGDVAMPMYLRLREQVPARFKRTSFGLEYWQWLGIAATLLIGVILDRLISFALQLAVRSWQKRYAQGSFRDVADTILRPFGLMTLAFAWWAGLNALGLPANVLLVLLVSVKFMACVASVWAAYRLVDLLRAYLHDRAVITSSRLDDAVVPLLTKSIKVFVTIMGVLFVADNLDIQVTSVLAGLGLGGLALALAAKDVASNLFGSVTVLLDQTYQVGDWVVIGEVEGTVERIGFRSTRIRTFKNSLVSVPNSLVTTASVDNLGSRIYRTFHCKLAIAYNTPPERIDAFCEGMREFIRLHPYTRKDQHQVYLNELGDSGLVIMIYLFWQVPDWGTELREKHRFLLDCLRLAETLGIEFAYPTQTVYMKSAAPSHAAETFGDNTLAGLRDARATARGIVSATTGIGVIPPPVGPSDYLGEDDRSQPG